MFLLKKNIYKISSVAYLLLFYIFLFYLISSLQDVKSKHKELRVQDLSDLLRPKNHSVRIYLNDGSYIGISIFFLFL